MASPSSTALPPAARFVYGPVPSRRLGRSLGIDLVPLKSCPYDCLYCQLGHTTDRTTRLREYVPLDAVLEELEEKLRLGPQPDHISLVGSGEPTLHARIGELIAGIKARTSVPVAVLTHGSLLWRPEVRAALAKADLVMPSLDAGTPESFERVNRPDPEISFERMVGGLTAFAREFRGEIWLEVFILRGLTDREEEVDKIAAIVEALGRPVRVQLNTVVRPPSEKHALAATAEKLEELKARFRGPCEVIADALPREPRGSSALPDIAAAIVALVRRHPCTLEGIASGLALRPDEVARHLDALSTRGVVRSVHRDGVAFYQA